MRLTGLVLAVTIAAPRLAAADEPAPQPPIIQDDTRPFRPPTGKDIVVEVPGERSTKNIAIISGTAGLGAVALGFALAFHLGSRSIADDLSAKTPTGGVWTQHDQDRYDDGQRDRSRAIVLYAVGGAAVIGAAIYLIATEPHSHTEVIHPHAASIAPSITPLAGGAVVGGTWSF